MNFGTDTDQIKDLVKKLNENAGKIETIISNIYSKLSGLNGNGWQGTGYDTFLEDCKAYEPALKLIPDVLRDFANYFDEKVTSNANTLLKDVKKGYDEIEHA